MGAAVGRNINVGTGVETVYGTPVAPSRWFEVLNESLEFRPTDLTSNGLRGGASVYGRRSSRRQRTRQDAGGSISMEVPTSTFGRWLAYTLGGTPSTAQQGATAAYLHTFAQGTLVDKSQTIQKQLRDAGNTEVDTFTYHGCKITQAVFSVAPDSYLTAEFTIDAEDEDTSTATASPSYSNVGLFTWKHGTVQAEGVDIANVTNASLTITNPMFTDGYYLGGGGLKAQPSDNDFRSVTGNLDLEFTDPAIVHSRFFAETEFELVLAFEGDNIEGAYDYGLTFTMPATYFTGSTPKVGGADVVIQNAPFEAFYNGTDPMITATYMTTDTTP